MLSFEFLAPFSSVLIDSKPSKEIRVFLLQFLSFQQNQKCLYASTEQESGKLNSLGNKFGIKTKGIFFFDLFTEFTGKTGPNPFVLENRPNAFFKAVERYLKKESFTRFVFDSLSTFMVYSSPASLYHSLFFKNRALKFFKARALYLFDSAMFEPRVTETVKETVDLTVRAELEGKKLLLFPEPVNGFKPFRKLSLVLRENGFEPEQSL